MGIDIENARLYNTANLQLGIRINLSTSSVSPLP